jgi:hypothetical protein
MHLQIIDIINESIMAGIGPERGGMAKLPTSADFAGAFTLY